MSTPNLCKILERNRWPHTRLWPPQHVNISSQVFDVQRKVTYKNLSNWYKELREYRPEIPCLVVANKIDGEETPSFCNNYGKCLLFLPGSFFLHSFSLFFFLWSAWKPTWGWRRRASTLLRNRDCRSTLYPPPTGLMWSRYNWSSFENGDLLNYLFYNNTFESSGTLQVFFFFFFNNAWTLIHHHIFVNISQMGVLGVQFKQTRLSVKH